LAGPSLETPSFLLLTGQNSIENRSFKGGDAAPWEYANPMKPTTATRSEPDYRHASSGP